MKKIALALALSMATGGAVIAAPDGDAKGEKPKAADEDPAKAKAKAEAEAAAKAAAELRALLTRTQHALNVEPRLEGKQIVVAYNLRGDKQMFDWSLARVEHAEGFSYVAGGTHGTYGELGANAAGTALHRPRWKGDWELECEFFVRNMDKDEADITVIAGHDPKSGRWVGARFGQQLVVSDGKRTTPASPAADLTKIGRHLTCTVRLIRQGDKVTLTTNGVKQGTATVKDGDGKIGFSLRSARIGIVKLVMHGTPELDDAN